MGLADRLDGYSETKTYPDGTVVRISIHRTVSDSYPSGWRYTLHYGSLQTGPDEHEDGTILRYDNAHEVTKGHECHRGETAEVQRVEFTDIVDIWHRFWRAVPKEPFGPNGED